MTRGLCRASVFQAQLSGSGMKYTRYILGCAATPIKCQYVGGLSTRQATE
jgi:hypothetical protein